MKKVITIILSTIIALSLPFNSAASSTTGNRYNINGITVVFNEDSTFSTEEQVYIAEMAVNGAAGATSTYNLLCTLLGHKETTETFTTIEHCVSATAPRCIETIQDVTACTRCETVLNIETFNSYYIFCCD